MKKLTKKNPYWKGEEFWTRAEEPDDEEIENVYMRLKYYEDLEEKLQEVYGDNPDLLETVVDGFVKHEGCKFDTPYKSKLLMDESVDKWEEWKAADSDGKLIISPCKIGEWVYCVRNSWDGQNIDKKHFKFSMLDKLGKSVFLTLKEAEEKVNGQQQFSN